MNERMTVRRSQRCERNRCEEGEYDVSAVSRAQYFRFPIYRCSLFLEGPSGFDRAGAVRAAQLSEHDFPRTQLSADGDDCSSSLSFFHSSRTVLYRYEADTVYILPHLQRPVGCYPVMTSTTGNPDLVHHKQTRSSCTSSFLWTFYHLY